MTFRICVGCITLVALTALSSTVARAGDWGYDDAQNAEPVPAMRARALPLTKSAPPAVPGKAGAAVGPFGARGAAPQPAAAAVTSPVKPGTVAAKTPRGAALPASLQSPGAAVKKTSATKPGATAGEATEALVEACWAQVYELAGRQKLEPDQRAELKTIVQARLKGTPTERLQARSVLSFWPKLTDYLVAHEAQRDNYASLLRALLRWKGRVQSPENAGPNADITDTNECALIAEVLGPQRLSVPGAIAFSEEAVNAYADMACFIFEQRNPGKTVDALDNRAVFSTVLSEKFKNAPTKKDQEAMAAFDLSWAKFKIVWTQANETQRAMLLDGLMKAGAGAAWERVHDSTLEMVLNHWPAPVKQPAVVSSAAEDQHK